MKAIVAELNRSRAGLLSAVERVPAERWQKRPGNGSWREYVDRSVRHE